MAKKKYSTYEYIDPDSEYTYPGGIVLKNKFDIIDIEVARNREYELVAEQLVELGFATIEVYSMKRCSKTPKMLSFFQKYGIIVPCKGGYHYGTT